MPCGPDCACRDADPPVECLSVVDPVRFGHLRAWCESGDEVKRRHVLNRSRIGLTVPVAGIVPGRPVAAPGVVSRPAPSIPLAGDLVAALTKRMGIDWVAKTVADELGVDCGCPERQHKLNALDAKLRRFLGMGG